MLCCPRPHRIPSDSQYTTAPSYSIKREGNSAAEQQCGVVVGAHGHGQSSSSSSSSSNVGSCEVERVLDIMERGGGGGSSGTDGVGGGGVQLPGRGAGGGFSTLHFSSTV
uniref:Uncharacterized protein n=1 Tax=Oryza meridionalis TaxID=40149 RepID=A0A0E0C1A9_9ORYZ